MVVTVCVCVWLSEISLGFKERGNGRRRKFESEYVCVRACLCLGVCARARAYLVGGVENEGRTSIFLRG